MRVTRARAGMALLACFCVYAGLTPALAEGDRTVWVAAQDANGALLPDVSMQYAGEAKAEPVPLGDGTWVIKGAEKEFVLAIDFDGEPLVVLDVVLPPGPYSWLVVHQGEGKAHAEFVSESAFGKLGASVPSSSVPSAAEGPVHLAGVGPAVDLGVGSGPPEGYDALQRGPEPSRGRGNGDECDGGYIYHNGSGNWAVQNALSSERRTDGTLARYVVDDVVFGQAVTVADLHWWGNEPTTFNWTGTADYIILDDTGAGGGPGSVVVEVWDATATRFDTGDSAFGDPIWYYSIEGLNIPLSAGTYWFGMRPVQAPPINGQGWWMTAAVTGMGVYIDYNGPWEPGYPGTFSEEYNVAFCITGPMEDLYGACCVEEPTECIDCLLRSECEGPGGGDRFAPETLCEDMVPPCGTGACCDLLAGTCSETPPDECDDPATQLWMGYAIPCDPDPCPCFVPCPPGAFDEPEACGDDTNGGCNSTPPAFTPIECDKTYCGTVWADGGWRDTDWYEITLADFNELTWTVESEPPTALFIVEDPVGDCDPYDLVLHAEAYANCSEASAVADMRPGTYYLFVATGDAAGGIFNGYPCTDYEIEYVATASCVSIPPFYCTTSWEYYEDEWITNVTFNTINNDTGNEGPGGYGDYTAISTNVPQGTTHTLSVTFDSGTYTEHVWAWIDWNQDWDFYDPGEAYDLGSGASTTLTVPITVPLGSTLGATRMRVTMKWLSDPGPCEHYLWGETEDYTVVVDPPPPWGACCVGMVCHPDVSAGDCAAMSGVYQGDGTSCTPNPCKGACCFADGSCLEVTDAAACTLAGGANFLGTGTDCGPPNPCPQPGGDCTLPITINIGSADLPHAVPGNNCGMVDDYDNPSSAQCMYYYDSGEDIIYELTVTENMDVSITLDPGTTTYGGVAIGDACPPTDSCMAAAYSSAASPKCIPRVSLQVGTTYYIMVDTWSTPDCIPSFILTIDDPIGPVCADNEGEGPCYDDYTDTYNGGCNVAPYPFQPITIGSTVCGSSGVYYVGGTSAYRDMDWFEFTTTSEGVITLTADTTFPAYGWIFDPGTGACDGSEVALAGAASDPCAGETLTVTSPCVPAGTYWAIVSTDGWPRGMLCGVQYEATVTTGPCPTGACCHGTKACTEGVTEPYCMDVLGGSYWFEGIGCDPDPCPVAAGEDCDTAYVIPSVPVDTFFDNDEMTADENSGSCHSYDPMQNDAWLKYTTVEDCFLVMDVDPDALGDTYDAVIAVYTGPDCDNLTEVFCADDPEPYHWTDSATSGTTYWFQIGDYGTTEGGGLTTFQLTCETVIYGACCAPDGTCTQTLEDDCPYDVWYATVSCDPNPCPLPGDNCDNPYPVTLGTADLPYTDNNTNCGRGDDHDDTSSAHCLYYYDSGEEMIYEITVTETMDVEIGLNPNGTTYPGVAIGPDCPPTTPTCITSDYHSSSDPLLTDCVRLEPGTYYIMVDTWSSPDCIPNFDLSITACTLPTGACCVAGSCDATNTLPECDAMGGDWYEGETCPDFPCPQPGGETCATAYLVNIPADLDYTSYSTTCGKGDDYLSGTTCMATYDANEDTMYELSVTADTLVDITLTNNGAGEYQGIALDSACPPGDPCIAFNKYGDPDVLADIWLLASVGSYWIMIDGPSYADCDDFILEIQEKVPPTGACCVGEDCVATNTEGECDALAGDWYVDQDCTVFTCPTAAGNDCTDTVLVKIPADLSFISADSTCGRVDDYSDTCMGSYDGGEDMIYELSVTDDTCVDISVLGGNSWTGIAVDDVCPLDAGSGDCIAKACSSSNPDVISSLNLTVGTYYLMVDIYPSPYCDDFAITISVCGTAAQGGDWDDDDGDIVPNVCDNCPNDYNPLQEDVDGDEVGDVCDNCPNDYNPGQENSDTDSHGDVCDNCPDDANEDQANSDNDSHGDVCDNCPYDDNENQADGDGDDVGNVCDNCPDDYNPDQLNSDGDSYGNVCDNCPYVTNEDQADTDTYGGPDGVGDACDNCPDDYNPDQADSDDQNCPRGMRACPDAVGDVCDNCVQHYNPDQLDTDGDTDPAAWASCIPEDVANDPAFPDPGHGGDVCDVCPRVPCHRDMDKNGIVDCADEDFIPTVSEWGLLVLALLLLTGAKVYFRRRTA